MSSKNLGKATHACRLPNNNYSPLTNRLRAISLGLGIALVVAPQTVLPAQESTSEQKRNYAIPSGPLAQSLNRFASEAGITLSFEPALVAGKQAPALNGSYSTGHGLQTLLSGSGLSAVRSGGGYKLQQIDLESGMTQLEQVSVTADSGSGDGSASSAYRVDSTTVGSFGERSLKDTPFSIEVFSDDLIRNKQARSIVDATKGDASITPIRSGVVSEAAAISIRGLQPDGSDGYKIDGLNVYGFGVDLPLEHFDSVSVLKGASGFLYGMARPGGIVNYISKRPTDETVRSLQIATNDSGVALLHGDLGGRFGAEDRLGYRLNLVSESGDTYIDDGGEIDRYSGSLGLDWRITPDLTWRIDALGRNRETRAMYYGLVPNADGAENNYAVATPPAPIDGSRRLASPFTSFETRLRTYSTGLDWQFVPGWIVTLNHRSSEQTDTYLEGALFANAAGDYSELQYAARGRTDSRDTQLLATGRTTTGPVAHTLTFGLAQRQNGYASSPWVEVLLGTGNLAQPGRFSNPGLTAPAIDTDYGDTDTRSVFASDTLSIGEHWEFIAGIRRDAISNSAYDRSGTSPTLAALYHPVSWLTLYGSYVEAFEEGSTAPPSAANAGQIFDPLTSEQMEIGVKAETDAWGMAAALFRLDKGLTFLTQDNVFTQDGTARYQGLEISGKYLPTSRWLIHASALLLDATNHETDDPLINGKRRAGTPRTQFGLYTEYTLPRTPWTLTAGARRVGAQPIVEDNSVGIPGYTLFDLGARASFDVNGVPATLRINLDNVADKAYWHSAYGYLLTQGAPRTLTASLHFEF